MAALYLDNDVAHITAQELRRLGHDVVTARDLNLTGAYDHEHLLQATQDDRILLTHNVRDFVALHRAWISWTDAWNVQQNHSGVLAFPQPPQWSHTRAPMELDTLLTSGILSFENRLYYWRSSRGWISA